jgi:hypothetical protein
MYQENLARETARHLREHIKDYLDVITAEYSGDETVPLIVPKRIDIASSVGGMINEFDQILPQYGIDILGKSFSPTDESLWSYEYSGQINGLVHGGSRESVDLIIVRHARAVEYFIRQHKLLHKFENDNFSILEFAFAGVDFSGAEEMVDSETGKTTWLAGFSINCSWFTSEDGPDDHGST